MRRPLPALTGVVVAGVVVAIATAVSAALTFGSAHVQQPRDWLLVVATIAPSMLLAVALVRHATGAHVANALGLLAASVSLVAAVEAWGESAHSAHPWPAAGGVAAVAAGAWVWNLTGLVALCLVFPSGRLPGRFWRRLPWSLAALGVVTDAVLATEPSNYGTAPRSIPGHAPELWPSGLQHVLVFTVFVCLLCGLAACVACPAVRYRRGDDVTRTQLRWLLLGAGSVPVLLAAGWVAILLSAPTVAAVTPFFLGLTVGVPAVVTVAVIRYDLFDIDRLLSSSVAAVVTAVVTAATFTVVVTVSARVVSAAISFHLVAATLVSAVLMLPTFRYIEPAVGSVLDRDRSLVSGRIEEFVSQVRDGGVEPEGVEALLRELLEDPGMRILVTTPGHPDDGWRDLSGAQEPTSEPDGVPLLSGGSVVGMLLLSRRSARRDRRARYAVAVARLPIEMSRLRMELQRAVTDLRASRARLVEASAAERKRLERDLHDGAQQQIIAIGMRLRSVQASLPNGSNERTDLDRAVEALRGVVTELRTLAHGLRPSRLDDGLSVALRDLASIHPQAIDLDLADVDVSDAVGETIFYVVSESLANAAKHAPESRVLVELSAPGDRVAVTVRDDGPGGAQPGFGIASLQDRVAAVEGSLVLVSPLGMGTRLHAEMPTHPATGRT